MTPTIDLRREPMLEKYDQWIRQWLRGETFVGACVETTKEMATVFPELRRVRGHYYCPVWGEREHWWLKAEDGSIVDPTVAQFPSGGLGEYVEWAEGAEEPVGKCANCGGYSYASKGGDDTVCDDECGRAYVAYLNGAAL
jgi:hypothetical protein